MVLSLLSFFFLTGCQHTSDTAIETMTSGSLSLLTYNVHGLPPAITGDNTTERMHAIAPLLVEYDIVGLQEDWMTENHQFLLSESGFPYVDTFDTPSAEEKLYGSGLTQLGTLELEKDAHIYYGTCNGYAEHGSDCFASKGIQATWVHVENMPIRWLNTHLEAGNAAEDQEIRSLQLAKLIEIANAEDAPTFITGDFNLDPSNPEERTLLTMLEVAGFENSCWSVDCPEPNHIDQIWFRSTNTFTFSIDSWVAPTHFIDAEGVPLSDHPPISVVLKWMR